MLPRHRKPIHPGEILLREFLEPKQVTQVQLAKVLGIPLQRINTIIKGKRGVTVDTALLFAKHFRTTPEFWMSLQTAWDLYEAMHRRPHVAAA